MDEKTTVQGRETAQDEIELIQRLIEANPSWNRTRLSKDLCLLWNWHVPMAKLRTWSAAPQLYCLLKSNRISAL
jgi:hypothetical protein